MLKEQHCEVVLGGDDDRVLLMSWVVGSFKSSSYSEELIFIHPGSKC